MKTRTRFLRMPLTLLLLFLTLLSAAAEKVKIGYLEYAVFPDQIDYVEVVGYSHPGPYGQGWSCKIPSSIDYKGKKYPVVSIRNGALFGCDMSDVTIPNSVTIIGERAFANCTYLPSVTIPNSVKRIENSTFEGCGTLTSVAIPTSVTEIGNRAFSQCGLTSITLPNSVITIGEFAFNECSSLTSVTLPNSVIEIGNRAFRQCGLTSVTIPKCVTKYGESLFDGCTSLASVTVSGTIIGRHVFSGCSSLRSLTIPCLSGTVESPGNLGELFAEGSFEGSRAVVQYFEDGTSKTYYIPTSLEELTISEGCGILPYGGLSNCNMLKKVTLPSSLYMVGEKAFFGCAGITDIYCQSADPAVAFSNSFDGMRLSSCKLHVPYNSADLYKAAEGWKRFTYIQEEAPIVIRAIPNILNAGVILGLQEYRAGQTAELRAVANSGYTFDGWFENGSLLTADDTYSFTVSGSRDLAVIFTPVSGSGPVTIIPEGTSITLTWPPVEGAESYEATLYGDAGMRNPVATVSLDGNGAVSVRHNAPGNLSANFAGLSELTDYYYSISAFDAQKATLSRYDGTFTTGEASVDSITDDAAAISGYYNLHGERSDTPWSGVNIVTYTDGSVRKMIRR